MSLLYLYVFSRVLNKKYKKLMGLKSFGFVCNVLSLFGKIILKPVCIYRYYIFTSFSNSCVVHLFGLPESECPGVLFLCCSLLITFLKVARNRGVLERILRSLLVSEEITVLLQDLFLGSLTGFLNLFTDALYSLREFFLRSTILTIQCFFNVLNTMRLQE